eukprot:1100074-Prymnesium_polylepis.1
MVLATEGGTSIGLSISAILSVYQLKLGQIDGCGQRQRGQRRLRQSRQTRARPEPACCWLCHSAARPSSCAQRRSPPSPCRCAS